MKSKHDDIADRVNKLHGEVTYHKKMSLDSMVECGKLLYQEKWKRPGQFTWWVQTYLDFSYGTASKYMRVYRLVKRDLWDKEKSVAENLAEDSNPGNLKHLLNDIQAREIAQEKKVKLTTAKQLVSTMNKIPDFNIEKKTIITEIKGLSLKQTDRLRVRLFEAMERAYDLGKRNKLLSMDEKRKHLNKIIEGIEKD